MIASKLTASSLKIPLLTALLVSASAMNGATTSWGQQIGRIIGAALCSRPVLIPALFGVFQLCARKPVLNFESRFSFDNVKAHAATLKKAFMNGSLNKMLASLKALGKDGWYFFNDKIVGQLPEKRQIWAKDNQLYVSEEKLPHGLFGNTYAYLRVLESTHKTIFAAFIMYLFLKGDFSTLLGNNVTETTFKVTFGGKLASAPA